MANSFGKGAYPRGSKVAASRTVQVKTSVVSVPPNRYGTNKKKP